MSQDPERGLDHRHQQGAHRGRRGPQAEDPGRRDPRHQLRPGPGRLPDPGQRRRDPLRRPLTRVVADAVAEGLIARAAAAGDEKPSRGLGTRRAARRLGARAPAGGGAAEDTSPSVPAAVDPAAGAVEACGTRPKPRPRSRGQHRPAEVIARAPLTDRCLSFKHRDEGRDTRWRGQRCRRRRSSASSPAPA